MEITLESIISIIGLLLGGGSIGGIFVWKYTKRKANAEALQAEAEAKKAEADARQEEQNYYQQVITDIQHDRDYYKTERDEYRETIRNYDRRIDELARDVARNGRMVEAMRPFMCGDLACKMRQRVVVSAEGEIKKVRQKKQPDIEPIDSNDL